MHISTQLLLGHSPAPERERKFRMRVCDSGREVFEHRAGVTWAQLVWALVRISAALCLSQKSPDASCLWDGKKKNPCQVLLLSRNLQVSFLLNSREKRKNTKDECGRDPYLSLFMWLGLPSSMEAGSENKDTKDSQAEMT